MDGIRTFTEERSAGVMQQIDRALSDANVCLVLGFGFHVQNVEMLSCSRDYAPNPIFMTVFGMGQNVDAVTDRMRHALKSENNPTTMNTAVNATGFIHSLKASIALAVS
jgi:hypothetical protein